MALNDHDPDDIASMSNSFNPLSSPSSSNSRYLDDHEDDGSKEHTGLLSNVREGSRDEHKGSSLLSHDISSSASSNIKSNRRQGNKSMVHSLYASPKQSVSPRRQASVPGSPTHGYHRDHGVSPMFISNMSKLWGNDDSDPSTNDADGERGNEGLTVKSRLGSSMIIEDASPPLSWEPSHSFAPHGNLSSSQRFSMDAISDGAFAVPSGLSDLQQLPTLKEGPPSINSDTNIPTPSEPKKKRWGPKGQKITPEPTLIDDSSNQQQQYPDIPSEIRDASPVSETLGSLSTTSLFETPASQPTLATEALPGQPALKMTENSGPKPSTFGLRALSGPGMGIVSGLTSLKNSIMIPALSSTVFNADRVHGSQSSSLAASQSSLLDFVADEEHPQWQSRQQTSAPSSRAASPSLLRSGLLRPGNGLASSGKDIRATDIFLEKKRDRTKQKSSKSHSAGPRVHRSTHGLASEHRPTSSLSSTSQHSSFRRQRVSSQNTAARSLSALESEFQNLIQKQTQLSTHKIELCKELLSLYSRRNMNEQKQEEAAISEQFDEADSAATTIHIVQDRIQKLEGIYGETDEALWKCKKRQDELGRSISEMQQAVMQEMEQMRLTREKEKDDYQIEMKSVRESEMERIQSEREDIEKEKSDVALGQDFLRKDESELLERMEEETKTEQDELDGLVEKRNTTRAEIQELTEKLEQLNSQDRELGRSIVVVQQKIATISQQFDGKAKEVSSEKRDLERRMAEVQRKTLNLDRQESSVQQAMQEVEAAQEQIAGEIQNIISQHDRLEEVRRLFQAELAMIQKLRLEEEAFREKEAGWNMRANSLNEDMRRYEAQLESLTNKGEADQRSIKNLELDLEAAQKRISTIESLKNLSVQRRDFKQASHCSTELAKCRETISQQQIELDQLITKMNGAAQEELKTLQKEYESTRSFVRREEVNLFKEIQAVTTDILARLETLSESYVGEARRDSQTGKDDKDGGLGDSKTDASNDLNTAKSTSGQLSRLLLTEIRCEIENLREMFRIRFAREETVPTAGSQLLHDPGMRGVVDVTIAVVELDGTKGRVLSTGEDVEKQRHALERDIQAAVAEEDYDTAAELQGRLDAL
ncbi:hypothetical protein BGZ58_006932 [Dissophora ornata]|nr:hypothetical protein BGZ58_006932 [Dissophora ornata]